MITSNISAANIGLYSVAESQRTIEVLFHYKINCNRLRDPIGQAHLRNLTGKDAEVQAFMLDDPRIKAILHSVKMMAAEHAAWTSIAFHDYHGKYISAALVELAAKELDAAGYGVIVYHPCLSYLGPGYSGMTTK